MSYAKNFIFENKVGIRKLIFVSGVWPPEGLAGQSSLPGSSVDYAAVLLLAAMAAVLLAAVGYQCAATWRWIIGRSVEEAY